jgi:mRNA-degrading endonuclease toxin of MazEF toxin-antitoxin module
VNLDDPADEPFLPVEGELYWVSTKIFWGGDSKPTRQVVVIEAPSDRITRIAVVTRTTDTSRKGVLHQPMPEIGLTKPGVFADLRSTEKMLWTPRNARRLGTLAEDVFNEVMRRFG